MGARRRLFGLALTTATLGALVLPAAAAPTPTPSPTDPASLLTAYAPLVTVRTQRTACGSGEPYVPTDVATVLDQPDVVLRSASGEVLATAPGNAELARAAAETYIDLPGNALRPGCTYERRFARASPTPPVVTYARVARDPDHPDQVALQYWLFWVYNDWNDKHEGDWEMLQVVFDLADDGTVTGDPVEVAVAQHEGSERRRWDDVERVGTRPVVYAAAGSHATYYEANRWFGKSAASGFGCDDTRAPSTRLDPAVVVLPDTVDPAGPFAWLGYMGHWGERRPSFNNGPTGPVTKEQWLHPIQWVEDEGRSGAVATPDLGTGVTDLFCGAVERASTAFLRFLDNPLLVVGTLSMFLAVVVVVARRTTWGPPVGLPIRARRSSGQILRSAWTVARRRWRHFLPISGLVAAVGALATVAQALLVHVPFVDRLHDFTRHDAGLGTALALGVGALVVVPATVFAVGAAVHVAEELEGPPLGWRTLTGHWNSLTMRLVALLFVLAVLTGPILTPLTLYLIALWAPGPAVATAGGTVLGALREAARLTRGRRWATFAVTTTALFLVAGTGPAVGVVLLLLSDASFAAVNLVAGLVTAALLPWLGLVIAMVHADLVERARPTA